MTTPPDTKAAAGLVVAAQARQTQAAISAQAMRDAMTAWPLLQRDDLDGTFARWLAAMKLIIHTYHGRSGTAAGEAYRAMRQAHTLSPAPSSLIRLAPQPGDEWLTRAFGYAGPGQLQKDTARPNTALSTTLGTTARIVQDGGRTTTIETVHADPVAVGWFRLTDGHPCAFCAMLASRGIAYKSEHSAQFQAHNDCGCTAVPAFTRSQQLPDVSYRALDVYKDATRGLANKDRLPAFRKAWLEHQSSA